MSVLRLLEELLTASLHLGVRQFFRTRGDPPDIAGRVSQRASPIAPELILHRHVYLRAGADRLVEERVAVLHV